MTNKELREKLRVLILKLEDLPDELPMYDMDTKMGLVSFDDISFYMLDEEENVVEDVNEATAFALDLDIE